MEFSELHPNTEVILDQHPSAFGSPWRVAVLFNFFPKTVLNPCSNFCFRHEKRFTQNLRKVSPSQFKSRIHIESEDTNNHLKKWFMLLIEL